VSGFIKQVRNIVENLTGYEIERVGANSFGIVDKSFREDAWFSYRAQVRALIEKHNVDLVIDAGANEGQFAQLLRTFYLGEIHSFEPVSHVFARLAETAKPDPKWNVHNLALGSQRSTLTINISDETVFSSLLKPNDYCKQRFGDSVQGQREEMVSVEKLDDLMETIAPNIRTRRVFLKMDTQGFDLEVFKGAGQTLRHVVALQSEVSLISIYEGMPHWTDSIAIYEQAGFGVVGLFPVTRDSGRVIEYDCLLTKKQS
jgi:FkbM family methyltransferase